VINIATGTNAVDISSRSFPLRAPRAIRVSQIAVFWAAIHSRCGLTRIAHEDRTKIDRRYQNHVLDYVLTMIFLRVALWDRTYIAYSVS